MQKKSMHELNMERKGSEQINESREQDEEDRLIHSPEMMFERRKIFNKLPPLKSQTARETHGRKSSLREIDFSEGQD